MFNRSEIMKAAWQNYRETNAKFTNRDRKHNYLVAIACAFQNCLRKAWKRAKEAIKSIRLDHLIETDPLARSLAHEILILDYKSWTPECAQLKSNLQSQLDALAA